MSSGTKQVLMCKYCVTVLAILAFHETLICEGRPMKPHKLDSYEKESKRESTKYIGDSTNAVDDFRPTTPGNSPGVGHEEEDKYSEALGASHNSIAGAKDDFRPTGPGHSPGVGHLLQNQLDDHKYDSITGGDKDDFRPTDPGHSPGAGHARNFVTEGEAKDDFRPTGPGHSPGVGHLVEQDKHSAFAGDEEDFRPTVPGHSPGIGHHALIPNKNRQP